MIVTSDGVAKLMHRIRDGTDDDGSAEWENARGVQGGNAMTDARQDPAQIAAAVISSLFTSTAKGREAAEVVEPDVLELRLHGVANTSPQDLLDLPREEIELAAGDALGSFWQPTPIALLRRTRARSEPILDRGEIPAGVHREAYSWGGMVRTTGDRGFGGAIVAGLARAGWALLLPFSMANTAIWSMQLRMRLPDERAARRSARAFVMRVAALLLTLLLVASTSVVALDIVARQCFEEAGKCPGLPGALDAALGDRSLGVRLAALSLVPVIMIGGLWWLAHTSRVRYDVADRFNLVRPGHERHPTESIFADPRYWLRDGETARLASMHFAAGVGLVATILFTTWDGSHPLAVVGQIGFWITLAVTLTAVATAGATATMPFERRPRSDPSARKPSNRWHRTVVIAAVVSWVGAAVAQIIAKDAWTGWTVLGDRLEFRMSEVTIVALLVALLALVIVAACFPIAKGPDVDAETPAVQHDRRFRAWHGRGPAVFLGMAVGTGMIWSSLIVVGLVSWLNGSIASGDLLSGGAAVVGEPSSDPASAGVEAPSVYAWFGLAALAVFVLIGIPVAIALICKRRLRPRLDVWRDKDKGREVPRYERRRSLVRAAMASAPPPAPAEVPSAPGSRRAADHVEAGIDAIWVGGRPGDDDPLRPGSPEEIRRLLADRISAKESAAARLHLAEHYAGIFAVGAMIALGIALAGAGLSALRGSAALLPSFVSPLLAVMLTVWTLIAIAVMSALVFGGSKTERPLAVIWDLSCFLPTAGHPLGPPTYLDRAAPEIARRLLWWLRDDPTAGGPTWRSASDRAGTGNVAVLVAHSMGAVLGTAALMLLTTHEDGDRLRKRISFLSYGVQLRAYFGRFFPELLGPDALGVTPCVGPRLFAFDPWKQDFEAARAKAARSDDADRIIDQGEGNPTRMPVHDWISLWRGNDELGFPAFSNDPDDNRVDRSIEEFDATGYTAAVATHGEYIRSPRYVEALLELAEDLRVANPTSKPHPPDAAGGA